MRCWKQGGFGRWHHAGMDRTQGTRERWCGRASHSDTSGNHAFDEYRSETLRRLEDEQRDFMAFLERLRQAKDKAEFDQFMSDRDRPSRGPEAPAPG